jgi:hypothetical protein
MPIKAILYRTTNLIFLMAFLMDYDAYQVTQVAKEKTLIAKVIYGHREKNNFLKF